MEDYSGSAMIALLPIVTDWCKIDCPHVTLVYAGETKDLSPTDFNDLAKDAGSIAMLSGPIMLKVTGTEIFGDEPDRVNVLRLQPSSELWAMRRMVESWDKSEYSEFKPHATIGPFDQHIDIYSMPTYLAFDRIMVGFGEDKLTFWLKKQ